MIRVLSLVFSKLQEKSTWAGIFIVAQTLMTSASLEIAAAGIMSGLALIWAREPV